MNGDLMGFNGAFMGFNYTPHYWLIISDQLIPNNPSWEMTKKHQKTRNHKKQIRISSPEDDVHHGSQAQVQKEEEDHCGDHKKRVPGGCSQGFNRFQYPNTDQMPTISKTHPKIRLKPEK